MTDENIQEEENIENEIDALKARASVLGIDFHPNIGVDKLKERLAAAMAPKVESADASAEPAKVATKRDEIARSKKAATQLLRVRLTCMNPNKKEWEGEVFSAANSQIGTQKKYVPFNVVWHVPRIILNLIEERKCQVFYTEIDARTKEKTRRGKQQKEFAIEYLDPLTEKELRELAQRQQMANGTAA